MRKTQQQQPAPRLVARFAAALFAVVAAGLLTAPPAAAQFHRGGFGGHGFGFRGAAGFHHFGFYGAGFRGPGFYGPGFRRFGFYAGFGNPWWSYPRPYYYSSLYYAPPAPPVYVRPTVSYVPAPAVYSYNTSYGYHYVHHYYHHRYVHRVAMHHHCSCYCCS